MLCVKNAYCKNSTLNDSVHKILNHHCKVAMPDEHNRTMNTQVRNNKDVVIENKLTYKNITKDNNTYSTCFVEKENIKTNNYFCYNFGV